MWPERYDIVVGEEEQFEGLRLTKEALSSIKTTDYESMEERGFAVETETTAAVTANSKVFAYPKLSSFSPTIATTTSNSLPEECVICLQEFDNENPLIPTLCNCGIGKTRFHLPCLLAWIDKNKSESSCPSCGGALFFEEVSEE